MIILVTVLSFIIVCMIIIVVILIMQSRKTSRYWNRTYADLEIEYMTYKKRRVHGSEARRIGEVYERMAMLFPDFPVSWEHDIIQPIMSGPIDWIIWKNFIDTDEEPSILFLDIKTGRVNEENKGYIQKKNQRSVRDAIENGNVFFEFFMPTINTSEVKTYAQNIAEMNVIKRKNRREIPVTGTTYRGKGINNV